jgi:hypothetical protein
LSTTTADSPHRYNASSTRLGVHPACAPAGNHDAAVGWGISFPSFVTTLPCASVNGWSFVADYVDGPGHTDWGQESFTWNGHSVVGHVCKRPGYVVRAYNYDQDLLVCSQ